MSYSYSSISKFEQCPRSYYYHYIEKSVPYKQSEAALYGSEHHDFLDKIVKGTTEFTPRYEFLRPVVDAIKAIPGKIYSEYPLAFHKDWTPTTWMDKTSFIKGKLDLFVKHPEQPRAKIIDYKFTGKVEPGKYKGELQMFSLLTFKADPELQRIDTSLLWLKTRGPESKGTYTRENLPELEDVIMTKIGRIEDAVRLGNFRMVKTPLCQGWCSCEQCENWTPSKKKY